MTIAQTETTPPTTSASNCPAAETAGTGTKRNGRTLFRSEIARGIADTENGVDREKGIIRGYSVISKGMAEGHGQEIDDEALDQTVQLANRAKAGLKTRFGHPKMSSEAMGTFLGRSKNFRREGDRVRADLTLDETAFKTPNGDLATYVMDLAENDPESFGASIVFEGEQEFRLNEDGTRKKDTDGKELPPLVRFKRIFASDVVDEPAANEEGFFGYRFFSSDVKFSAEASQFMDKFLADSEAVRKTLNFLQRYASQSQEGQAKQPNNNHREDYIMEWKDISIEGLKKERPDVFSAILEQGQLEAKANTEGAVAGERKRATDIVAKLEIAEYGKMLSIVKASVESGDSLEKAEGKMKDQRIKDLQSSSARTPGPDADPEHGKEGSFEGMEPSERAEAEWEKDGGALKKEFKTKTAYVAYRTQQLKGRVRHSSGKVKK